MYTKWIPLLILISLFALWHYILIEPENALEGQIERLDPLIIHYGDTIKATIFPAWLKTQTLGIKIVTAYSSSPDETWGDPFITASGERVKKGIIACPRSLKFGTEVIIKGERYICKDRLHPRYDNRFDIWKSSKQEALEFGKQKLEVKVVQLP